MSRTTSDLINTSAADLDASIRCAYLNNRPFDLATLRAARDAEAASTGARTTVIKLLEREIRRQGRAA